MSTLRIFGAFALLLSVGAARAEGPSLGQPVTEPDLANYDISIPPDGAGLPPGSGTAAQGAPIFAEKCVACHGEGGKGGMGGALVGGIGSLAKPGEAVKTVGSYYPYATTVFDMIRRSMPFPAPRSLSNQEVYALTAYILNVNGIVGENDAMNADTLSKVRMPNRDGFIQIYPTKH
jgi:mono/diheme cytochrome c family protein